MLFETEFKPKEYNIINKENIIFIVGMCPGKQRKKDKTNIAWEGNKSGDFLTKIIKDYKNLYLTNIFNTYSVDKIETETIEKGKKQLLNDINLLKPKKIICLGDFAFSTVMNFNLKDIHIIKLKHPSYILRFNGKQEEYINQFKGVLNEHNS
jgi:uracil-DNA glycosylase